MTEGDDLVGQMMAAMRSNDPDVVLELYADDCQVADPAMQLSGKEGLRRTVEYFFAAFHAEPKMMSRRSWSTFSSCKAAAP